MGFLGTCQPWTIVTSDPATQVAPTTAQTTEESK